MRRSLFAAATLLLLTAPSEAAERVVRHSFRSSTPAAGVRSLLVEIPAGEIRIVNGPSSEIRIAGTARRDFDAWDNPEAQQRIVDAVDVEAYVNGRDAIVRRRFGPAARSWRSQKFTGIELTLEVPPGISVAFDTSFGEVRMNGTFGDIDVRLRAGEVYIRTPRSDVRELNASCRVGEVYTNLGHEIVTREGLLPGRTHFENPAGRTRINAHVTAGEIHVDLK